MDEQTKAKILEWISDNHMHHDHEDILVKGDGSVGSEYTEKWVDCQEAQYPYVNSLELEKFILSLEVKL